MPLAMPVVYLRVSRVSARLTLFVAASFLLIWSCAATQSLANIGDPLQANVAKPLYPKVSVNTGVEIKTADGTTLRATTYLPADKDGNAIKQKFPVVAVVNAYNREVFGLAPILPMDMGAFANPDPLLVRSGYAQIMVDVRGTGTSDGIWKLGSESEESDDLYDIFKWLDQQEWSNKTYGMVGVSYLALNTLRAAHRQIPGLKAAFAIQTPFDGSREALSRQGVTAQAFFGFWAKIVPILAAIPDAGQMLNDPAAALKHIQKYSDNSKTPNALLDSVFSGQHQIPGTYQPGDDRSLESLRASIGKIKIPTFVVSGWYDLLEQAGPETFNGLNLPVGQKQLLIGPWTHGPAGLGLGRQGTPPHIRQLTIAWFDRWLKGVQNGVDTNGGVTTFDTGSNSWHTGSSWPPAGNKFQRLYLEGSVQPKGVAASSAGLTSLRPKSEATQSVPADESNQFCSRSAQRASLSFSVLAGSLFGYDCAGDDRFFQQNASLFTSAPLDQDLRIAGSIGLKLKVSSEADDGMVSVSLADVDPNTGVVSSIANGTGRLRNRKILDDISVKTPDGDYVDPEVDLTKAGVTPVTANVPVDLKVGLTNIDSTIPAGHRLRLIVRSSDNPWYVTTPISEFKNHGLKIQIDPKDPSFLVLPVSGSLPASVKLPPAAQTMNDRSLELPNEADRKRNYDRLGYAMQQAGAEAGSRLADGTLLKNMFTEDPFSSYTGPLTNSFDRLAMGLMFPDVKLAADKP